MMQQLTSIIQQQTMIQMTHEQKIDRTYSCRQFIQIVTNLHNENILYYCRYSESTLMDFYRQIQTQTGGAVETQTILQFIAQLKQNNRQSLLKEIQFYYTQINQYLSRHAKMITRKQFRKIIDRYQEDSQLLTQILIQNSKQSEHICCQKVLRFIQEVRVQIEQTFASGLTIDKLKNCRLSHWEQTDRLHLKEQSDTKKKLGKSNYFQEIEQYCIKKMLSRYMQCWHRKLDFYRQFINDSQVRQDMKILDEQICDQEHAIWIEVDLLLRNSKQVQNTCEEFEDILQGVRQQQNVYQSIIEQHQNQRNQLKQEIQRLVSINNKYIEQNKRLQQTFYQTKDTLISMAEQQEQLERQVQNHKNNYAQLYRQYQLLVVTHNQQAVIKKEETAKKIFLERTVKEQLEDTLSKLERNLTLRERERRQYKQKQDKHIEIISTLQARLQSLQSELRQKNESLNNCIRASKRISYAQSKIKISPNPQSKNQISQCLIYDRSNLKNRSSSILGEKSKIEYIRKSKFAKINICFNSFIDQEQGMGLLDGISLHKQQNITKIIEQDDSSFKPIEEQSQPSERQQKNNLNVNINATDNSERSPLPFNMETLASNTYNSQNHKKILFSSKAVIINIHGLKFQTFFLLTKKRFCLFDSKLRLSRFIPIVNIKSLIFCYNNPTLFVLKVKSIHQLQPKKHLLNDSIFSTRKCSSFACFLAQHYKQILTLNKIEVNFKQQRQIWLSVDNKQINIKSHIRAINHPLRLCLSSQPVFCCLVLQNQHLFNRYKSCCCIVQPAAIFCFQGNEVSEIQSEQIFLFILPLVDRMSIKQQSSSEQTQGRCLKIQYFQKHYWNKTYSLLFSSSQELKKFTQSVELQLLQNRQKRQKVFHFKTSLFHNLNN